MIWLLHLSFFSSVPGPPIPFVPGGSGRERLDYCSTGHGVVATQNVVTLRSIVGQPGGLSLLSAVGGDQ